MRTAKPARVYEPLLELIQRPVAGHALTARTAPSNTKRGARQRPSDGTFFSSRVRPSTPRAGGGASTGQTNARLAIAAGRELASPPGSRFELRGRADNVPAGQEFRPCQVRSCREEGKKDGRKETTQPGRFT